ncbi:hypothetical protein MITS9508_02472 [Synechococcus sp. MIT S9508]|nr:hypothetical protein MITS9508_02472 [Synechococcus sp. MIT S9508]
MLRGEVGRQKLAWLWSRASPFSDNFSSLIDGRCAINDTLVGSGSNVQRQLMMEADRSQKC